MRFTNEFLLEIRARVPLSDVIGKRVRLVRKGREFSGLCPFHNEKTPSFTVNDNKQFWHCFGCGAHGDVFGFFVRLDNLDFVEAVEQLAQQVGLEIPKLPERDPEKEKLRQVAKNEAHTFSAALVRADDGRAYLKGRGLTDATVEAWRLGICRDGFFHGRVTFPIFDVRGRTIAFGARAMGGVKPKYLNSSDSKIFSKGAVLYGAHMARPMLKPGVSLAIVEGYMDVIMLWQHGIPAVATLGTGFTERQLIDLWRITGEPVLMLDGDSAGKRAAERAIDVALPHITPGKSVALARLPEGHDPDSYVRTVGADVVRTLMREAMPISVAVWDIEWRRRPLITPEAQADFFARLRARVAGIKDVLTRQAYGTFYKRRLNQMFGQQARRVG